MIRNLISRLRDRRGLLGIVVIGALLAGIVGVDAMRGTSEPTLANAETSSSLAAPLPLADTDQQIWEVDVTQPMPEPDPREGRKAPEPTPTPNVNWHALAAGAADVEIAHDPTPGSHADLAGHLSGEQAHALIAAAEMEEAQAGSGRLSSRVGAVIAQGTPSQGSGTGICK